MQFVQQLANQRVMRHGLVVQQPTPHHTAASTLQRLQTCGAHATPAEEKPTRCYHQCQGAATPLPKSSMCARVRDRRTREQQGKLTLEATKRLARRESRSLGFGVQSTLQSAFQCSRAPVVLYVSVAGMRLSKPFDRVRLAVMGGRQWT